MKRRNFLAATGLATAAPFGIFAKTFEKKEDQQYFELIKYHLKVGSEKGLVENFYRDVAIPVLNGMGISPVGIFRVRYGANEPSLYILIPHKTVDSFVTLYDRLMDHENFWKEGRDFLNAPLSNPAYIRIEKILYRAFKDLPAIEVPEDKLNNNGRIYELRIYESHNLKAAKKKIEMFNEGGEIAIFKKTGLTPVFFGETLVGPMMPNLTYMLVFDNMEARDRNWSTFVEHPDWKSLSSDVQYADTVSNITDFILSPAPFSQV
jgi:hypothetical protein